MSIHYDGALESFSGNGLRLGVLDVVLLGEPQVSQELGIDPLERRVSLGLGSVDPIPVLLLVLIMIGVIL